MMTSLSARLTNESGFITPALVLTRPGRFHLKFYLSTFLPALDKPPPNEHNTPGVWLNGIGGRSDATSS